MFWLSRSARLPLRSRARNRQSVKGFSSHKFRELFVCPLSLSPCHGIFIRFGPS